MNTLLSNLKVETLSKENLNALRGGKNVVYERTFTTTTINSDGNVIKHTFTIRVYDDGSVDRID